MGYIGQTPSAVPLDGSDIADDIVDSQHYAAGSIDTAHIADVNVTTGKIANDAITLAKMAAGTDGNLITYDASGNPAAVATGSSGQVLTSAGAGAPPTFSAAPSHSGNVAFPATQSAAADVNTLDDYQEGTWTPILTASTNDHTYATQYGFYVKIGKYVHCHALVALDNLNSTSGNSRFGGLPFTASATTGNYGLMFVSNFSSLNITAGYNMFGRVDLNETSGGFSIHDSGTTATSIQFSELSADATVYLSIQYYV
jgi:hypothetical protein